MNISFVIYSIFTVLLFVYCGIGLTILLCPKKFQNYTIFFAPLVGLAYISAFSWWGIHFFPGGINSFIYPLLLVPAFFLVSAIWIKKEVFQSLVRYPGKDTLWLILVCTVVFIIISLPEIFLLNSPNVLVIGNNDIINYATISKFLVSSSLVNPVPGVDAHILYLIENDNFGAFVAAAVPSAIFSVQTYMMQNTIENLFCIFSLPIIYIIAVEIFRYRPMIAIIASFIVGLNFNLIYILYTGFVGQVLGCGMFLALLSVTLYPILNCREDKEFWDYIPLAAIFLFGVIATYSVFIPLFFVPALGFLGLTVILKKSLKAILLSAKFLLITSVIGFVIAIPLAINKFNELVYFSHSIPAGWPMPVLTPERAVGLAGNDLNWLLIQNAAWNTPPIPLILRIILSLSVIIIIFLSLRDLFRSERKLFYFALIFIGIISIGYLYYSIIGIIAPVYSGDSYKAYKLLTYGLPVILIIFFSYFRNIDIFNSKKKNWLCIVALTLFIAGVLWSGIAMMDMVSQKSYPIKPNIIDLQKINNMQNVSSINIEESGYSDQMWIYYFLFMNKTLYLKYSTYFQKSPLIGDWNLESTHNDILNPGNTSDKIPLNDDYYLVKNDSLQDVRFINGWYEPEYNPHGAFRWTGRDNETPTLGVYSSNLTSMDISLTYVPLIQNNSFSVELDNKNITDCTSSNYCEIKRLVITPGDHTLIFNPKIPPTSPGPADSRTLGYAFIFINITSNTLMSSGAM